MLSKRCCSGIFIDCAFIAASVPWDWGGFFGDPMTFEELKNKALSLPFSPGVYIMRNGEDTVIYVGKAKKLKNRVSQYFQDTASHTPKTRLMVSKILDFDIIVASLIKGVYSWLAAKKK